MIRNLENKLKFIELVEKMKEIERAIVLRNWKLESDAEHSFHLAFIVMVFVSDFPELDNLKCIKIALIHDIVEIYAWDTIIFDKKMEKTKKQREFKALERFEKELRKDYFLDFKNLIQEYINRDTLESEFVHQMDKFQPIMTIVLEWWSTWHRFKFDKYKLLNDKYAKIDDKFWLMKVLQKYFDKAEKEDMFYIENKLWK